MAFSDIRNPGSSAFTSRQGGRPQGKELLEHLSRENSCITKGGSTHWMAAITPDCDELEEQLIL